MTLDLRIPVGLLFSLIGIILVTFGIATNGATTLYECSQGINVNLWWGIVLLIFGQIMFQIGRRAQGRPANPPSSRPNGIAMAGRKARGQ